MNSITRQKNFKNSSEEFYSTIFLKTSKLCANMGKTKYMSFNTLSLILVLILFGFLMAK